MTDFLFARPSVLEGIGRNIDLFGILNIYNISKNGKDADARAHVNDVMALGNDFRETYKKYINGNQS